MKHETGLGAKKEANALLCYSNDCYRYITMWHRFHERINYYREASACLEIITQWSISSRKFLKVET